LLCLLAYAAGIVTGIALWMPTQAEIALLNAHGSGAASATAAARLPLEHPALPAVGPPPVLPTLPAADTHVKAAAAPPPAPPSAHPSPVAAMAAPLPAPVQPPAAAAPEEDVFSLQLGAFRDPKNAKLLQADLKERGYSATILTAVDSEQREWYAVRIHGFKTVASAARAAAEFTNKERMQALIRASDGL
jgi:cell division protein FtsN